MRSNGNARAPVPASRWIMSRGTRNSGGAHRQNK